MRTQFINALMRIRFPCALQKLKRAPFFCSRFERHLKSSREKSEEKNEYQEILHCVHISLDRFLSHSLSAFGVSVHFICLIFIIFVDVQVALKCMFPHTHTAAHLLLLLVLWPLRFFHQFDCKRTCVHARDRHHKRIAF